MANDHYLARTDAEAVALAAAEAKLADENAKSIEIITDLRRKLALAGVEGSPPPGDNTTIGKLQAKLAEVTKERDGLRASGRIVDVP